ncbi:MAG TPA: hypothetical protein PLM98_09050 [Thiolinea sp.]|nr:hypothetical protein [Thiolinea sp.]
MTQKTKWWVCSKIVWLNVLGVIAALLYALEPLVPQLEPLLPREVYGWVVVAIPVLTIVLRAYSVNPVRLKRQPKARSQRKELDL